MNKLQEQMKTLLETALTKDEYHFSEDAKEAIKNIIKSDLVTAEMLQMIIFDDAGYDFFSEKIHKRLNKIIKKDAKLLNRFIEEDFARSHEIILEIYFNKNTPKNIKEILFKNPIIADISEKHEIYADNEMIKCNIQSFDIEVMCNNRDIIKIRENYLLSLDK